MKRKQFTYTMFRSIFYGLAMAMVFLSACDDLEKDELPAPENIELETQEVFLPADNETVISLVDGITSSAPVSIKITEVPQNGTLEDIGQGYFKYTPKQGFTEGVDAFSYEASSGSVSYGVNDINIKVSRDTTDLPCTLFAFRDTATTTVNKAVLVDVLANDWICDTLKASGLDRFRVAGGPFYGKAEVIGESIRYVPAQDFVGNDIFIYKICKERKCAYSLVKVKVEADSIVDCLDLMDDNFNYLVETDSGAFDYNVLGNDQLCGFDAVEVGLSIDNQSGRGSVRVTADNKLVYDIDPSATVDYTETFTYRVCTPDSAQCATANVSVNVRFPACDDFMAVSDNFIISSDSVQMDSIAVTLNVLANDHFCDSDSIALILTQAPANGSASVINNQILYLSASSASLPDTLSYSICNQNNVCDDALVVVR